MLTKQLTASLKEISKSLQCFINDETDPGLLTGYGGAALFYAYYYKLTGKKNHLDTVHHIIEKMLSALSESELTYSHCSGISGIAWCIQHLVKEGFIKSGESEDMFEDIDAFLADAMIRDLGQGFYDFLHMGIGVTLYFLDRLPHPGLAELLEEAVRQLENTAENTHSGIAWPDRLSESQSLTFNLGLSHGVPAVLSVLSILHEKNVAPSKTLPMLTKGTEWLLSVKNKQSDNVISLYPWKISASTKEHAFQNSRMGWCYGDLSIATTLWNLGERVQNNNYRQEAIDIFQHTLQHRNKDNGNVHDASLCHGSMGISHIYRRMYSATGEKAFLKGSQNWLRETLHMATWKDGPAGFKYRTAEGYKNSYNLLDGITGIGLAMIAAIDGASVPSWDGCLLIS